jgi:hypothetical protein
VKRSFDKKGRYVVAAAFSLPSGLLDPLANDREIVDHIGDDVDAPSLFGADDLVGAALRPTEQEGTQSLDGGEAGLDAPAMVFGELLLFGQERRLGKELRFFVVSSHDVEIFGEKNKKPSKDYPREPGHGKMASRENPEVFLLSKNSLDFAKIGRTALRVSSRVKGKT